MPKMTHLKLFKIERKYSSSGNDIFHRLNPLEDDRHSIGLTNGLEKTARLRSDWNNFQFQVDPYKKISDFFIFDSFLVAKSELTQLISTTFKSQVELLKTRVVAEQKGLDPPFESDLSRALDALNLHILHCIKQVYLEESADVEEWEPGVKRKKGQVVMSVSGFCFSAKAIKGLDLFFQEEAWVLFCTERFKEFVDSRKLTGIVFKPIKVALID